MRDALFSGLVFHSGSPILNGIAGSARSAFSDPGMLYVAVSVRIHVPAEPHIKTGLCEGPLTTARSPLRYFHSSPRDPFASPDRSFFRVIRFRKTRACPSLSKSDRVEWSPRDEDIRCHKTLTANHCVCMNLKIKRERQIERRCARFRFIDVSSR